MAFEGRSPALSKNKHVAFSTCDPPTLCKVGYAYIRQIAEKGPATGLTHFCHHHYYLQWKRYGMKCFLFSLHRRVLRFTPQGNHAPSIIHRPTGLEQGKSDPTLCVCASQKCGSSYPCSTVLRATTAVILITTRRNQPQIEHRHPSTSTLVLALRRTRDEAASACSCPLYRLGRPAGRARKEYTRVRRNDVSPTLQQKAGLYPCVGTNN